MKTLNKVGEIIPGLAISVLIAFVAKTIEGLLPIHIIGASVIALFIGMIINHFYLQSTDSQFFLLLIYLLKLVFLRIEELL